jgi:hypothetical protein
MNANELREAAESVAWWLDPENAQARKELSERRPELAAWLSLVEARVNDELKRREEQEEVRAKA